MLKGVKKEKLQKMDHGCGRTWAYLEMKRPLALSAKIIRRFSTADRIMTPASGCQMTVFRKDSDTGL